MLSLPAFATITPPGNPDLCEQNPGNPHCHEEGGNGGNGGNGGDGGNSTVNIDISGTLDVNNSNTNTLDNSNSNTTTIGDVSGGDATATGGSINIYGGGEEGGDAPFSNNNEIDNSSTATIGDQSTEINVDASTTDNSFDGGNTLIVGGGEGEGGAGTLNSNANAEGGSAVIEEGANTNNNTATGGNATVESGAVVVENNVTIEGGESVPSANSQTVEGDDVDIQVDARTINEASTVKPAVNSVAPSFSGICNSGAAGQSRGFALSLAVTNDVCQALMIADAYMALGDVEEAHKWVRAAARHAGWKGGLGYIRHLVTLGIL
jgi:hypothetical protein